MLLAAVMMASAGRMKTIEVIHKVIESNRKAQQEAEAAKEPAEPKGK